MESPRKNNDCYFYYYSTCLKGDGCLFRHEPSALGCETVCTFWQQGKCLNQHCNFRHMELRKNRKIIPCYWENQPGGCRKPHCSFMHKLPREAIAGELDKTKDCENVVTTGKPLDRPEWSRRTVLAEGAQYEECVGSSDNDSTRVGPRRVSQSSEASYGSPSVDPLVVNFEEESDNESVPTSTPTKKPQKNIHVKTLEEIRLERIQAESAAFYSYDQSSLPKPSDDLRSWIDSRKLYHRPAQDFKILSLDEIRKSKGIKRESTVNMKSDADWESVLSCHQQVENNKLYLFNEKDSNGVGSFTGLGIKTETNCMEEDGSYFTNDPIKCLSKIEQDDTEYSNIENEVRKGSLKRSHSPVMFNTSPKKSSVSVKEEVKNLTSDEEDGVKVDIDDRYMDWKSVVENAELPKRTRKPLRRTHPSDRPSRPRLRRGNVVNSSDNSNVSELIKDGEVLFTVPVVEKIDLVSVNGQTQSLVLPAENSMDCLSETDVKQNGTDSVPLLRLQDSHSETDSRLHVSISNSESYSQIGESYSEISRSKRCSIESADEEMFLNSQDNGMTLEAEEDILQDIDDLLKD